ncbi:MAG: sialidase family protein, partial [Nitrososphaerota archaeon]
MKRLAVSFLGAFLALMMVLPLVYSLEEANLGGGLRIEFQSTKFLSSLLTGRLGVVARGEDPVMRLGEAGGEPGEKRVEAGGEGAGLRLFSLQAPGAAGILVPFRSPAPAFSRNIIITRDFSRAPIQTEPHIAVNPKNPNHLLVGVIDYNFAGVSAYVSLDGGETWSGPRQVRYLKDDAGSGGDPVVAFDREGNAYFASISIGIEEYRIGSAVSEEIVSSIVVSKSPDGGFSWSEPVSVARSGITFRDIGVDEKG